MRRCASRPLTVPDERLLRYCARPPFALDRLREFDPERLLYENTKARSGGNGPLLLTPLEQLERPAALVPPRIRLGRHGEVLPRMAAHRIGTFANGRSWPH
jgi:hypothetical protein